MRIVGEGAAPAVQIVIHQIVVRLQLLPRLLPQLQLLPVVEVTAHREDLVLELNRLVPQVAALVHLLEVDQLVRLYVELEDLGIEPLGPPAPQNIDRLALGHRSRVREREEKLGRENRPLVGLGVVDLDGREPFLAVVASKDVDAAVADDGREGAPRSVQPSDRSPLLVEHVVGLAPRHPLVLPVVATDHVDLAVEVHAGMLLPRKVHRLPLFEAVLLPRRVEVAVARGPAARDEDLTVGKRARRGVVLNLAVVDGRQGVAIGKRA